MVVGRLLGDWRDFDDVEGYGLAFSSRCLRLLGFIGVRGEAGGLCDGLGRSRFVMWMISLLDGVCGG